MEANCHAICCYKHLCLNSCCCHYHSTTLTTGQWIDSPTVEDGSQFVPPSNTDQLSFHRSRTRKHTRHLQHRRWPISQLLSYQSGGGGGSSSSINAQPCCEPTSDEAFQEEPPNVEHSWQSSILVPIDEEDEPDEEQEEMGSVGSVSSVPQANLHHRQAFNHKLSYQSRTMLSNSNNFTNRPNNRTTISSIRKSRSESFLSTKNRYHRLSDATVDEDLQSTELLFEDNDEVVKRRPKSRAGSLTSLITSTIQEGFNRMFRSRTITGLNYRSRKHHT